MQIKGWIFRGGDGGIIPSKTSVQMTSIGPRVTSPADVFLPLIKNEVCAETRYDIYRQAFETDPYCPGIWLLEAEIAVRPSHRALHLREAAVLGWMAWREYEKEHTVRWWDDIGTRPTLRALYNAAIVYCQIDGKEEDASACLEHLLELDPADHLGAQPILDRLKADYCLGYNLSN